MALKKMDSQNVKIIRSDRKTISIQITPELLVIMRIPRYVTDKEAADFLEKKKSWIDKKRKELREISEKRKKDPPLTEVQIRNLAERALEVIPLKVEKYARILQVTYGRITIRNQKTRWGSCSAKGNLNFNCLLMLAPDDVVDYVVVHELCHRLEMNHSLKFWKQVERILPGYREQKEWLNINGAELMGRML